MQSLWMTTACNSDPLPPQTNDDLVSVPTPLYNNSIYNKTVKLYGPKYAWKIESFVNHLVRLFF